MSATSNLIRSAKIAFMDDKLQKIQSIFRELFDDDSLQISPDFSQKDSVDWDSLMTVKIALAVESEFGVKFLVEEIANLKSVSDILKKLQ